MHPVRRRRLQTDLLSAHAFIAASTGRVALLSSIGDPPESYVFEFRCRSLTALAPSGPVFADRHQVHLQYSAAYPAQPPFITMLSPLLHPHIWPNRVFCLGTWRPAEKLDHLLQRVAAILTYDPAAINWRSIADDSAVAWARAHAHLLPLDRPFPASVPSLLSA